MRLLPGLYGLRSILAAASLLTRSPISARARPWGVQASQMRLHRAFSSSRRMIPATCRARFSTRTVALLSHREGSGVRIIEMGSRPRLLRCRLRAANDMNSLSRSASPPCDHCTPNWAATSGRIVASVRPARVLWKCRPRGVLEKRGKPISQGPLRKRR